MTLFIGSLAHVQALADTIAVIGTGNVGAALGMRFAENGHEIVYGSRTPDRADVISLVTQTGRGATAVSPARAVQDAEIVVLAVPWEAVIEVVDSLGDLSGKIVVDPTNPRRTDENGLRDYALDTSNAERIQERAPRARVVKAFSTLGSETMLSPGTAGGPVTVPIVGDNPAAKRRVAALVEEIGLEVYDVGPLRFARVIEGLHYLRYNSRHDGVSFNYYLRPESISAN